MDELNTVIDEMSIEQAIEFIRNYIDKTKKTQALVAQELGISSGALSSFLAGNYKTPHTIVPKVKNLVEISEKKKITLTDPPFVETSVSKLVENAIKYSHLRGKISVVYGDAGIGKTQAFRHYLQGNSLAIGITISPTYSSITGVNELLAEQLGVRERVARKITNEIITRLKGSGRVILIDEAQHLTVKALNHIRCLADESGIGICLIGNEDVYSKLKGTGKADFAQLFSRIGMREPVSIQNIKKDDIRNVFRNADLQEDAIDILYQICHTNYGLRGAVNVFVNTAAVFNQDVNAGTIARMMREMNIGR
ncbi:MAG: AAA family ATPase [Lachnospiraceae bacterium]|nr:AAA family ATPase [Lachnospiraceae bacterium]